MFVNILKTRRRLTGLTLVGRLLTVACFPDGIYMVKWGETDVFMVK